MIDLTTLNIKYSMQFKNSYFPIIQIGCGGTGGNIVQNVAQVLSLKDENIKTSYTIVDPDVLESKNLKNQLFIADEVGEKKSDVLAERYSIAFNTPISSYSESYIETIEDLKKLFFLPYENNSYNHVTVPIIIGAVDNNATRQLLNTFFNKMQNCIYIDAGNEAVTLPDDGFSRDSIDWSTEEREVFNNSGWTGQVCCGLRINNETILKPVAEQFEGILTDVDSIFPSQTSCSVLSASEPQRIFVNKMSAFIVSNMINEIITTFSITNHFSFFHAKKCYIRSIEAIQENK